MPVDLGPGGVGAFASRHAPDWSMTPRSEPWHKLLMVLSGEGRLCRDADTSELSADMLLLIPAGTTHRLIDAATQPLAVAGLCLDAPRIEAACGGDWPKLLRQLHHGVRLDRSGREALLQLVGERLGSPNQTVLPAWGRILLLLGQVLHLPAKPAPVISAGIPAALAWLDEHIAQPMSVAELAARAGLSYRAFTTQVRRHTGESVVERIVRLRVHRAAILLRSGMPVVDAALACGFGDLSGFYRHFRRHFGTAPVQWTRTQAQLRRR